MNVWNPSDDLEGLLLEGTPLKIYNVNPSFARRKRCRRQEGVGLVANRMTRYEPLQIVPQVLNAVYPERHVMTLTLSFSYDYNIQLLHSLLHIHRHLCFVISR